MELEKSNRRSTILGIALGTLLALLATGVARAQSVTEEFHKTYELSQNGSVKLKNINGSVKITGWDQNQVKVDAVKRAGSQERLNEAKIVVESDANSFYVWTQYPEDNVSRNCCDDEHNCHDCMAKVDYTIMVPRNARISRVSNVNGGIEISGVKGEVNIETVNGKAVASGLSGASEVSSVNGTVEANFDRLSGSSSVHAVNGRVSITVPSDASMHLKADSLNGAIENDFGLPERKGQWVGHNLEGKIGDGSSELKVNTVNGRIEVRHASDGKPLSPATSLLPRERTLAPY